MKHFCLKALGCTAKPVPAIYDLDLPRVIEAVQHPAERPEISVAVTS
ncbi:lanosterol synthase [Aspergillus luchuensis]|uniref:Lanosterol synthase n=1 Tax=Aspergillus kawachii TaxID=1069201 RepID=A0A146FRV9_ASPKA|nr:lanosterol synthase [Aspergillus luchuensis]